MTPWNNAQGLFDLKFLTAVYGLCFSPVLFFRSGGWGFRACGRDQGRLPWTRQGPF